MRLFTITFTLLGLLATSAHAFDGEAARDEFLKVWKPLAGKWQLTLPQGASVNFSVMVPENNACVVHEHSQATYVFGWHPGKKKIVSVGFSADGMYHFTEWVIEQDGRLVGETETTQADGTPSKSKLILTIKSQDEFEAIIGNDTWLAKKVPE